MTDVLYFVIQGKKETAGRRPGKGGAGMRSKRKAIIAACAVVILLAAALVFFTCTEAGRLARTVGIPCQVEWSERAEEYGYTLYLCRTKEGPQACALRDLASGTGASTAVGRGPEVALMRSYVENGAPKTRMLRMSIVTDPGIAPKGTMEFDAQNGHFTIRQAGDTLIILCDTESAECADHSREIGLEAYTGSGGPAE